MNSRSGERNVHRAESFECAVTRTEHLVCMEHCKEQFYRTVLIIAAQEMPLYNTESWCFSGNRGCHSLLWPLHHLNESLQNIAKINITDFYLKFKSGSNQQWKLFVSNIHVHVPFGKKSKKQC